MVRQSPTSLRKAWIHEEQEKDIKNRSRLEIERWVWAVQLAWKYAVCRDLK